MQVRKLGEATDVVEFLQERVEQRIVARGERGDERLGLVDLGDAQVGELRHLELCELQPCIGRVDLVAVLVHRLVVQLGVLEQQSVREKV